MSADDTSSALADHYARQNLETPGSLDHFWMPLLPTSGNSSAT